MNREINIQVLSELDDLVLDLVGLKLTSPDSFYKIIYEDAIVVCKKRIKKIKEIINSDQMVAMPQFTLIKEETIETVSVKEDIDYVKSSEELKRKIADRIKFLLRKKGVNQSWLASQAKVHRVGITRSLDGKQNFTIDTLCKLSQILGENIIDIPKYIS